MKIGGLLRTSLIEYPKMISAVIFTQGCNFGCPYCHNPELVDPERYTDTIPEKELLTFLHKRKNLLDAVVITGGEPTIYEDLPLFMERIKKIGYQIKLDTNGTNPDMLKRVLDMKLADYVAMDLKAPLEKYSEVTRVPCNTEAIKRSIEILGQAAIEVEFRTTVLTSLLTESDVAEIGKLVPPGKKYILQHFEATKTLDPSYLQESGPTILSLEKLADTLGSGSQDFAVR